MVQGLTRELHQGRFPLVHRSFQHKGAPGRDQCSNGGGGEADLRINGDVFSPMLHA